MVYNIVSIMQIGSKWYKKKKKQTSRIGMRRKECYFSGAVLREAASEKLARPEWAEPRGHEEKTMQAEE